MDVLGHLKTINRHKFMVMKYCFKVGLYKQGLLHDLSKYTPSEFMIGAKYYQAGKRSPNNAEREEKGYSSAWLHHKGRNKHHWEFWTDYAPNVNHLTGCKMPEKYVIEMFLDRVAASKNYNRGEYKDYYPLDYYLKGRDHYSLHPDTKKLLEHLLHMLAEQGEEATLRYIKYELIPKIKRKKKKKRRNISKKPQ